MMSQKYASTYKYYMEKVTNNKFHRIVSQVNAKFSLFCEICNLCFDENPSFLDIL